MEQGARVFMKGDEKRNFQEENEKLGDADHPKIQ